MGESVCRLGEAGKDPWCLLRARVSQSWRFSSSSSFRMLRLILCSTIFLCLIVPAPAPFAKSDPRSIFNFLSEPPYAEPEPRNPRRRPAPEPEPEAEPRNGRLRTEQPAPEPE